MASCEYVPNIKNVAIAIPPFSEKNHSSEKKPCQRPGYFITELRRALTFSQISLSLRNFLLSERAGRDWRERLLACEMLLSEW
jgi:hypothetical protein